LQVGGPPAFAVRATLAATLSSNWGIYGPAFELTVNQPISAGREEYLNSEKYEIRQWKLDEPGSIKPLISRLNEIRRDNPALQTTRNLEFHPVDNERIIVYSKSSDDRASAILVVVNLDPQYVQSGWLDLNIDALGLEPGERYQVHDLLDDSRYLWHGARNYVELNPIDRPGHVFRVRRSVREEAGLMYFE